MEIKQLLHDQRKRIGYTLEELSKMVGVSKQTVQKWESGKIGDMKRSHIAALSTALNIPIEILVGTDSNFERYIPLTHHEGKVVNAYRNKPALQPAVDKLLDVEPETNILPLAQAPAKTDDIITFDDFDYAMYDENKELTEADKGMLLNMAKMLKERKDKEQ